MSKIKRISLGNRLYAIIDPVDFESIGQYRWHAQKNNYDGYVAIRKAVDGTTIQMHRELMGVVDDPTFHVDHINCVTLDNRRKNLRLTTRSENAANRCKFKKPSTSPYKGVSWHRDKEKWQATIRQGKVIHLGYFDNEEDAALHRDDECRRRFGEFGRYNFPHKGELSALNEDSKEIMQVIKFTGLKGIFPK